MKFTSCLWRCDFVQAEAFFTRCRETFLRSCWLGDEDGSRVVRILSDCDRGIALPERLDREQSAAHDARTPRHERGSRHPVGLDRRICCDVRIGCVLLERRMHNARAMICGQRESQTLLR